jgi:hypothetical protein
MSRARQNSHVHVIADNVDQAVEDLAWDWSRERRQTWAIDTGTPVTDQRHPLDIEAEKQAPSTLRATLGRARLKEERAAVAAAIPERPDPQARRWLANLDRHIDALDRGLEPYSCALNGRRSLRPAAWSHPRRSAAWDQSSNPKLWAFSDESDRAAVMIAGVVLVPPRQVDAARAALGGQLLVEIAPGGVLP